jgi:hypothetical protein
VRRLWRARRLPAAERRLLLAAYGLLWLTVLCLRTCRLHRTRRMAARGTRFLARVGGRWRRALVPPELVGWAVGAAARHVPGATCLAQALTAQALLALLGTTSTLHIGVSRRPAGGLDAHAWVRCMGMTVVGGIGAAGYAPLLSLDLR